MQGQTRIGFVSLWIAGSLPEKEERDGLHFMSAGTLLALPCAPAEAQLISPSSECMFTPQLEKTLWGMGMFPGIFA